MNLIDKYITEGGSRTPKYVVDVDLKGNNISTDASEWKVKQYGKPSDQTLAKWVKVMNDSIKPGGVNDHLGKDHLIIWAGIRLNKSGESYIVQYGKKK
jgi:hypothetical protein